MSRQSAAPSEPALRGPSNFWEILAAAHSEDLQRFGFQHIKRRQALRYFTWRWHIAGLWRSEQMRFLLGHTSPLTWLRCATEPADISNRAWEGVAWPLADRWLYTFAVRLLWEYAASRDRLGVLQCAEPALGNPLPVRWRRRLISQDLANAALEAGAISKALNGRIPRSILEVGAGYGRTAYVLLSLYPRATYAVVDIEPALSICRWYLSQLFPSARLCFLLPEQAVGCKHGPFDLGLSISSLQEMTPSQVSAYLSLLNRLVGGGTVYLKQWREWRNPVDGVSLRFEDYPIPDRWILNFREPAPVQSRFLQAAWDVPGLED